MIDSYVADDTEKLNNGAVGISEAMLNETNFWSGINFKPGE